MSLAQELLPIEERLWTGGADAYRETLAEEAVVVVPHQVLDRASTIAAIEASPRWDEVRMEDPRAIEVGADSAVLTYEGRGRRGETRYAALVTSVYARADGSWRLAAHQQTPLPHPEG